MKRLIIVIIIALYALLTFGFLYFDFIDFVPKNADVLKFATIYLSFITAAFLWRDSFDRFDGTILLLAMISTVVTDIFLVFRPEQFTEGMALYGFTMSVYFFRYQKASKAIILPFLTIIPVTLHLLSRVNPATLPEFLRPVAALDQIIVVTTYYIQILAVNLCSIVLCVRRGKYPKINAVLIIAAMIIFLTGDVMVVIRNFFGIKIFSKFIWIFYTPSQALLAFSANDFAKDRDRRLIRQAKKPVKLSDGSL